MSAGTYQGVNYAKKFNTVPPQQVDANWQGNRETWIDSVETLTGTGLDAGSQIKFFRPPQGARLVGGFLVTDAGALASGGTLEVGVTASVFNRKSGSTLIDDARNVDYSSKVSPAAEDTDKFLTATAGDSQAKTALLPAALLDMIGYEFDGQTDVIVTSATAALITGKTITLALDLIIP